MPEALRLICDTWREFRKPSDDETEPSITARLGAALDSRNRHNDDFPVMILTEQNALGNVPGQIDLCFCAGRRPEVYFGFEAKKLNTRSGDGWASKADAYTSKEGMGRFISGKYSPEQKHAGMLGYVMDGDCPRAIACIGEKIADRRAELQMNPDTNLQQSQLVEDENVLATQHEIHQRPLTIHHLFLAA